MNVLAGSQHCAAVVAQNFVSKTDAAAAGFAHTRPDPQQVVVSRRAEIAAARFGNHDITIVLPLHLLVGDTSLAHVLDAPDLEKCEVVAVVDHAHLVGLFIAHAHECFGKFAHPLGPPDQRGWRFSRNAASPSRKSGVERMATLSATANSMRRSISASLARTSRRLVARTLPGLLAI